MKWIRLWVDNHMNKDTCWKDLNLAERGAFYSLLIVAGKCNLNGEIAVAPGVGYSDKQLAALLHCTEDEYAQHLAKLTALKMVERRPDDTLFIVNWSSYQDEFARQRKYKMRKQLDKKATDSATPESYATGYTPEVRSQKSEAEVKKQESLERADALVNQFADAFREATGEEYDRNWSTDRKWAKELLAKHGPATADLLKTRLANAIAAHKNNTADYWRFPSCARQLSGAGWNKYATPPPSNGQRPRLVDPTRRAMTPAEVEASLRD